MNFLMVFSKYSRPQKIIKNVKIVQKSNLDNQLIHFLTLRHELTHKCRVIVEAEFFMTPGIYPATTTIDAILEVDAQLTRKIVPSENC